MHIKKANIKSLNFHAVHSKELEQQLSNSQRLRLRSLLNKLTTSVSLQTVSINMGVFSQTDSLDLRHFWH